MKKNFKGAFTVVELIITIAIIMVGSFAVILYINPAEYRNRASDSKRVTEIQTLDKAITELKYDQPNIGLGTAKTLYISLPASNSNCSDISGLPVLTGGWVYHCANQANLMKNNGTGWIPLDFSSMNSNKPVAFLPIDPKNTAQCGFYYTYAFSNGEWELSAVVDSQKYRQQYPQKYYIQNLMAAPSSQITPAAALGRGC